MFTIPLYDDRRGTEAVTLIAPGIQTRDAIGTDRGSQFISMEFTQMLKDTGIAISMDGKGCWRDNLFVERLWKSIKYVEFYLRAYETIERAARVAGKVRSPVLWRNG